MSDTLHTPSRERVVTTNAWAFLRWLAAARGVRLADWAALQPWSVANPAAFDDAIRFLADLPNAASRAELHRTAELLLHLDLRPDDVLLVVGPADWSAAAAIVAGLAHHDGAPEALLEAAAGAGASVLIAPAAALERVAFRRGKSRLDLARLRSVVALGGPMAPNARDRLVTWGKSGLMLLARAGEVVWGDPLSPVLRAPPAQPALGFRPPPSADRD